MTATNCIIDLSHHNTRVDFASARADGIAAVIFKATQGTSFVDPTFSARRVLAKSAGLLVGAYHFGTGSLSGSEQADFFLKTVNPDENTLIALDFEKNPTGPDMTMAQAGDFISFIIASLGRPPVFYISPYWARILYDAAKPAPAVCPLWLSEYGPKAKVPSPWSDWTLWQYTDGADGPLPHVVAGIGRCDRSYFNGTLDELKAFWNWPTNAGQST